MKLTVKDLLEYLSDQNPEASICFFDTKKKDYVQMENYLFKKVSNAKRDYEKNLRKTLEDIEPEELEEIIGNEMRDMFKFVKDDDILIGLKNN